MMKDCLAISAVLHIISAVSPQNVGELAQKKCRQYSNYAFGMSAGESIKYGIAKCDSSMIPLIIGGTKADRTEFPHQASIGYGGPTEFLYACGGSLISEKFVLSAGHCIKDRMRGAARVVRLGSISLINHDDHTRIVAIEKILPHPNYKASSKYNDIALMRLARSIYFNEFIRPACINVNKDVEWSQAIATGFGLTSIDSVVGSNNLLKVQLNTITTDICRRTYGRSRVMSLGLIESQFCAGVMAGNRDTCQGDSGGPLQILLAKPRCLYSIIGVTSFGKSCGFRNTPAIYTSVAHYTSWIEEIVWKNKSDT